MTLQAQYKDGFAYTTIAEMAKAYVKKLFRFDQLYRLFHKEEDNALLHGGDNLNALKEKIETSFVSVPEQGGSTLIPDGAANPGVAFTVSNGASGMPDLYRMELQVIAGSGKLNFDTRTIL